MTMIHSRPRSDFTLSGGGLGMSPGTNWFNPQPDSDVPEILTPQRQRNYNPTNMLLYGRRGQGKTLTLTAILKMFHDAFWDPRLGKMAGKRRVASNYWVKFAQEAGPLGYEQGYIELPNGDVGYGKIPIDPCDPELPNRLVNFPPWAAHRLIAIDEIADVLNSGMANSRLVRDWSSVFRQQRKLRTEFIMATQFPQQVARNAVVTQVDLMVLVKPHFFSWSADLLIFDIHGSLTGNWGKHQYLPPREIDADWERGIENLHLVKDEYNTYEMVPPSWSKSREAITKRQYAGRASWALHPDHLELMDDPNAPEEITVVGKDRADLVEMRELKGRKRG